MGNVILGMTVSLDGFVNDRNGSVEKLYADMAALQESESLQEAMRTTGAVVMGRHSYDMAQGDFTGYEFQVPLFIVTHHPPETVAKGENENLKFHFVTDGVERAVAKAKAAAGDKDVTIVGGASIAQQCINAGLADEIHLDIMPVLFGDGLRFFGNLDKHIELETLSVNRVLERTQFIFRVVK